VKASKVFTGSLILFLSGLAAIAQTFPPVAVTGPFPKGTEEVRKDAPVDSTRTASPMIYHEYTCYKVQNAPIIDGNIETDSIWAKIPWTLMTFWESQGTDRTFTVFSGDTSDTWKGPKDCTAWFKLLWDDNKLYGAVKVYTNIFNPVLDTMDLNNIYQSHCVQMSINSAPPAAHIDFPEDPFMGCELGFGLATVYPVDSLGGAITTAVPDTSEVYHCWNPAQEPSAMSLAPGNNSRSNGSVKGKAIHISVEKTPDYYALRYEFALSINDSVNFWSPFIHDDHVGRFSIMAMDYDEAMLEAVSWASGILISKDFNQFGSIKWSVKTPDGVSIPTAIKKNADVRLAMIRNSRFSKSSAAIDYTITRSENVQLAIYSFSGKKLAGLVDRFQSPGTYHVSFSAAQLSKGAYWLRLKTATSESTAKLMVIK
jgi:hypothetical protein